MPAIPADHRKELGGRRRKIASAGSVKRAERNGLFLLPPVTAMRYPTTIRLRANTRNIEVWADIVLIPTPRKSGLQMEYSSSEISKSANEPSASRVVGDRRNWDVGSILS